MIVKIDKLDFIKTKGFCSVKDTENEKTRQTEKKYLQKTYLIRDTAIQSTQTLINSKRTTI
jgi:ethanolamine utilization cobalamin adenosyltransferase